MSDPNVPEKLFPMQSLMASARRMTSRDLANKSKNRTKQSEARSWQDDAWDMYDLVGELRFLSNVLAARGAKAHLFVGRKNDESEEPERVEDNSAVTDVLDHLGGSAAGRAQIIRRLMMNLNVAGEGWIVGVPKDLLDDEIELTAEAELADEDYDWHMLSISEVKMDATNNLVELDLPDETGAKIKVNPDELYLIRVWWPHPRKFEEADSATKATLPVLRELVGLTMHISAQVDSRLAGAGVFVVPQSAQRALRTAAGLGEDSDEDQFTEALMEAMLTPIGDRANASAVVPLVVTVPDEAVGKFEHLTFTTPLDGEARALRDEAIRRLALGQDAPPELLLGTSSMNHWGGWLVKEETVSSHIEPPLALICDALTTQYLWPMLMDQGLDEEAAREYVIWYDVAHLIVRPNHSADAITLHGSGVISDEAVRREAGFDETDAPEPLEAVETSPEERALEVALDMLRKAPQLANSPGLPQLVRDIRSALDGSAFKEPDEGVPTPVESEVTPTEDEEPADVEDNPETVPADNPTPAPSEGAPSA